MRALNMKFNPIMSRQVALQVPASGPRCDWHPRRLLLHTTQTAVGKKFGSEASSKLAIHYEQWRALH